MFAESAHGVVLWNDPARTLAYNNGPGADILHNAVKRDDSANDALYFKIHIDPLSDKDTEDYFAGLELFENDVERLGIGNAMKAWAYSAFFHSDSAGESNDLTGYVDLHTSKPETPAGGASGSYQYPRRGIGATIVFKAQYVPGEDDLITVWLNPDLGPGANEAYQPESLTTRFNADASFDEIRLRHSGAGGGWAFSDLAIATSFTDFVDASSARPNVSASAISAGGAQAFNFQAWQKDQGLPQPPIRALAQTRDGYLWVGSAEGLARFDGLRFVSFGAEEGIKGAPITALLETDQGALWIGTTDNGLICWQNHRITSFTKRDGLPSNTVTALAQDASGRLWIGTALGLRSWQNDRFSSVSNAERFNGSPVTALATDPRGGLWIGVKGVGVFQLAGNLWVPVAGTAMEDLLKDSHCLLADRDKRLWIGAGEDFVLCRENDRWTRYRIPRNQAKAPVTTLAEESDGTVWAGSPGGGLFQLRDGKAITMPPTSGLAGNMVETLLYDRQGSLWVGTDAGLNRLRRKTLFTLGQAEGLGFGATRTLAEVAPGVVWVSKPNDGLYRWDGKGFSRLYAAGFSPHDSQISCMLVTHDGFCWVATTNSLLLYKDPVAAADEVKIIAPAKPGIISMAEDGEGGLWIGTVKGNVWQYRQDRWHALTGWSQTNAITALRSDADGSMWIGTDGSGLYRVKKESPENPEKIPGLSSLAVRALHLDAQRTLWIGTADGGLSRWREGRMATVTTREGLPDNNISQILEDDTGRLWLGSSRGIASVNKLRMEELASRRNIALSPQLFHRVDGMLPNECTGGFSPAGLKAKSGLLWFSTLKGVAVVNPRFQAGATLIPHALLEEVLVDGVPTADFHHPGIALPDDKRKQASQPQPIRIIPGKHRVEFRYTGLGFDAPELIRFRYRLEGLDTEWVDAGARRAAFYSYLPPNDYRFHVACCNSEGVWSSTEATLQLTVLRHFWQSWWFIGLASITLIVAIVGTVHFIEKGKLHRRLKRLEQERALERERTRIAQDLHDEMGAKLCRISFLSEHARRGDLPQKELHDQITSISDASREVLHSLDEIVWAVNPQNDTLEHVASYIGQYAHEYFQMTGVQCELDIPPQLPPHPLSSQMRHHLFLATHEALTNILKHSAATNAKISMSSGNAEFKIDISDNGKGLPPRAPQSKSEPPAADSGDGLSNMQQRLEDIGGSCRIVSSPGQGTHIQFIVPLNCFANHV
jgi:ligand-binding sensor domain-containing protein/signal transduction histidine kinase